MSLITAALTIANTIGLSDLVGKWFGGNDGDTIAQSIITTAKQVTGKSVISDIITSIKDDENISNELQAAILTQQTSYEKMAFGDKQDARYLQAQTLNKTGWLARNFIYLYASFWAIFSAFYFAGVTFLALPPNSLRFADLILGFIMGTVIGGIISFFYGASLKQPKAPPAINHQQ